MKQYGLCLLALTICLCSSVALAAPDAWYGGGGYDGHDQKSALVAIGCPQVNNAAGATNITASSACLNGMLLATGSAPAVVHVYWGTVDGVTSKGNWGAWTSFGVCVEGHALTTNVSVAPGVTYYYRFYATNAAGEDVWAGASASFRSLSAPVLNSGAGAAPLSYTTATLNGNLTGGESATIYVYWGPNTNAWANTNSLGSRTTGLFWTPVSGLSSGTLCYYRCYGTNIDGEGWSDTVAFTTRVESIAISIGGSYDGYDRRDAALVPFLPAGTIIYVY